MKRILLCLLMLIYLSACSHMEKKTSVADYIKWYNHNQSKLTTQKEIGAVRYSLQYIPVDFMVLRAYSQTGERVLPLDSIKNIIQGVNQQFFTLQIGPSHGSGHILYCNLKHNSDYEQRVNYYSFEVKDDMLLVAGNDTLRCIDSHFERSYGLTPYITLNLIFPSNTSTKEQDIQLLFNDVVFNTGKVKFTIPKETLKTIPILNDNNK